MVFGLLSKKKYQILLLSFILTLVPKLLTKEMNALLSQDFKEWEVEAALKQLGPLKALGPDGMAPLPPSLPSLFPSKLLEFGRT